MTGALARVPAARLRWYLSFAVIAALHIGAVSAALFVHSRDEAPSLPPPAVLIELPPMPAPPPAPPRPMRPLARPELSKPPPPPAVRQAIVPPAPARNVAVSLPKAKPNPPVPESQLPAQPIPARPIPAQPQVAAPPAPVVAASAPPAPAPVASSDAVPTWQGLLLARLERFKRFPATAQIRHQQGVTYVRFTMDRRGKIISAAIDRSSGFAALDDETLALIHRAEPLPPPPPDVAGDTIELDVPIQFFLKPGS